MLGVLVAIGTLSAHPNIGMLLQRKLVLDRTQLEGAAIGTVLLPGIGTAIGARIGGAIGDVLPEDWKEPATK